MKVQSILLVGLALSLLADDCSAEIITSAGGSLTMTYDGAVFANTANSNMGLSAANGDFMRYGRYWGPSETVKGGLIFVNSVLLIVSSMVLLDRCDNVA